ncbi:MAG: phosphatidate cytidylyltransferase, partial [Bacteroidia bacterium]|nr:phosphatidate cytidylyltransferase [Bacteroidia bacterium]
EYQKITSFHKYGVMIAGWCILLYFTNDVYKIFGLQLHAMGWWIGLIFVFILPITELLFAKTIRLKNIRHSILGLIYISLSWGLMMDLYNETTIQIDTTGGILVSNFFPLAIIVAIWINDTMAYIIGSLIGKTPLTKISPKKTWEGTISGIVLSAGIAWIIGFYILHYGYFTYHLMVIAVIASICGTLGDILESKLKRLAGVKDSGSVMPGHGGFLDRFDSMLVAVPFIWLYVVFVIR